MSVVNPKPRGGARPGAGRPVGSLSKRSKDLIVQVEDLGLTPGVVMHRNLVFYFEHAEAITRKLYELVHQDLSDPDWRADLLQAIAEMGKWRELAQRCAVDLAPYVHPRLQAVAFKNMDDKPLPGITSEMGVKDRELVYRQTIEAVVLNDDDTAATAAAE